jgi:hypothetical protein
MQYRNADRPLEYTPLQPLVTPARPWYVRYEIPLTMLVLFVATVAMVSL